MGCPHKLVLINDVSVFIHLNNRKVENKNNFSPDYFYPFTMISHKTVEHGKNLSACTLHRGSDSIPYLRLNI